MKDVNEIQELLGNSFSREVITATLKKYNNKELALDHLFNQQSQAS